MKINYRRQHNYKIKTTRILLSMFLVGVLLTLLYSFNVLTNFVRIFYVYAMNAVTHIEQTTEKTYLFFTSKHTLIKENQTLRSNIKELHTQLLHAQSLAQENKSLRLLLNDKSEDGERALARVIDYKNEPYGTLLVKLETDSNTRIRIGDAVTLGKWVVGTVAQIQDDILLVNLLTANGNAYDVLIGDILGTFTGTSNGTGMVLLPRSENVKVGTVVTVPSQNGLVLGTVEMIESQDEDAVQKIYIRTPFNLRSVRFVTIEIDS